MSIIAGLFLIAHGLVHLGVWVGKPPPDAPFDSHHSWLLGDATVLSRLLAVLACIAFVVGGILILAGSGVATVWVVVATAISLLLIGLTFNRWFVFGLAINVAILIIALS